jgi:hypothetical protein
MALLAARFDPEIFMNMTYEKKIKKKKKTQGRMVIMVSTPKKNRIKRKIREDERTKIKSSSNNTKKNTSKKFQFTLLCCSVLHKVHRYSCNVLLLLTSAS